MYAPICVKYLDTNKCICTNTSIIFICYYYICTCCLTEESIHTSMVTMVCLTCPLHPYFQTCMLCRDAMMKPVWHYLPIIAVLEPPGFTKVRWDHEFGSFGIICKCFMIHVVTCP